MEDAEMKHPAHLLEIFVLVVALAAAGCEAPPSGDDGSGAPSGRAEATAETGSPDTAASQASPTRAALPGLFSIMTGLQRNMATVGRGLWLENLDTVAAGADAVADHPRVPPEEFQRISDVLGPEMSRFGGMDMEVHDLAVRLAEEARAGDLEAVLGTDAELRRACVACHSAYRERLRREIP